MSKSNGEAKAKGEDDVLELPLLSLPGTHPCHKCGACCRYLAIEIDNPTSFTDHEHIHWYLAHKDVSVYVDWEGDWFIEFVTVCENLTDEITCAIYEERPQICSEFSWNECEQTTQESAWKYRFVKPEEYIEWHREKRPKSFERYLKKRKKLLRKREAARDEGDGTKAKAEAAEPLAG